MQKPSNFQAYDYGAERTLLADIMVYSKNYVKISDQIKVDDFKLPEHRILYEAIGLVMRSGEDFDNATVMHRVTQLNPELAPNVLRIIGDIATHGHHVSHVVSHANIVRHYSLQRRVAALSADVQKQVDQPVDDLNVLIQETANKYLTLLEAFYEKGMVHVGEDAKLLIGILQDEKKGIFRSQGITLGFKGLDYAMNGLDPGEFMVVGAPTGDGKSAFAMNIVQHVVGVLQLPVLVVSLEMTRASLVERMAFSRARISRDERKHRQLTQHDYDQVIASCEELAVQNLYIDDTSSIRVSELYLKVKQAIMQKGVKLLVVDYIQLINGMENEKGTRAEQLARISRTLKGIANKLEIGVICPAQLNRQYTMREGPEGKKPQLGDIRESAAIEHDADIVCFLFRPDRQGIKEYNQVPTRNRAICILDKQRNGMVGEFDLRFNPEYTLFEDLQEGERPLCTNSILDAFEESTATFNTVRIDETDDLDDDDYDELDPIVF